MKYISVIILGLIQGLSEFLPISSSAHLIIFRDVFGIGSFIVEDMEMCFDISLHLGTLLAIFLYFFRDFIRMFLRGVIKGPKDKEGKLLYYVIVATIPAAIVGFFLDDLVESYFRTNLLLIIGALVLMGILLYIFDIKREETNSLKQMTFLDAILIGLAQCLALVPGFSRSGATITMARIRKINRVDAAKFSFYLSLPVTAGAVILKLIKGDMINLITNELNIFIVGVTTSFIVGIFTIKFLLKFLNKHEYNIFMWYRLILSLVVLLTLYLR